MSRLLTSFTKLHGCVVVLLAFGLVLGFTLGVGVAYWLRNWIEPW